MQIENSTQTAETVNNAIQFGAIGFNVLLMTLTVGIAICAFALKKSELATKEWLHSNRIRFVIAFFVILGLSVIVVVSPDVNILFQAIGFNPDKSPVALGLALTALLIGSTSEPTKAPAGQV